MGGGDLERDNMAELIFFRIHLTLDVFQHAIAVRGMKVADSQVWEQGSLHDSPSGRKPWLSQVDCISILGVDHQCMNT